MWLAAVRVPEAAAEAVPAQGRPESDA
jgi:hypothetical protein